MNKISNIVGPEGSAFVFQQRASLGASRDQVETVTLQLAKICVASQSGEIDILWRDNATKKVAEFPKESFTKGKSKMAFRVCVFGCSTSLVRLYLIDWKDHNR